MSHDSTLKHQNTYHNPDRRKQHPPPPLSLRHLAFIGADNRCRPSLTSNSPSAANRPKHDILRSTFHRRPVYRSNVRSTGERAAPRAAGCQRRSHGHFSSMRYQRELARSEHIPARPTVTFNVNHELICLCFTVRLLGMVPSVCRAIEALLDRNEPHWPFRQPGNVLFGSSCRHAR